MINKDAKKKSATKRNEYLDQLTFDGVPSPAKDVELEEEEEGKKKRLKKADQPVPVLGPN